MGNFTTSKHTDYANVRIVSDAKHFPKNAEQPAVTYVTFVDGTKNGEDLFIDARIVRGADLMKVLKKGDILCVRGPVEWSMDRNGKLRGKIYQAEVSTTINLKDRAAAAPAAETAADAAVPQDDSAGAVAFD